jgi:hypothetical protein
MFVLVVMLAAALPAPPAKTGQTTVQIVYESDTRGYYLPCG